MRTKKINKVVVCGSISAADEILNVKGNLEKRGYNVDTPQAVLNDELADRRRASQSEKAKIKIKNDVIRKYYKKIFKSDIVLVVNPTKKGVPGYIGGNTFLEMGFAHVLNNKLYLLNPVPNISYSDEIHAMQPLILFGDLGKITKV